MKCNAYESESMKNALGETLRPGGFSLTEKGVQFCKISENDPVLDLGCGRGATVNFLYEYHHIKAAGIDPSEKLISEAKYKYTYAGFIQGRGENLPFQNKSFYAVFAECTLSLMEDLDIVIDEVHRVLKNGGWFIITDVYAKNRDTVSELNGFPLNSCMRGMHDLQLLKQKLQKTGFGIEYEEDCSDLLKQLLVKIGFTYGSMSTFWNLTSENCIDGCRFSEALKQKKPGYFMLIVRKK